MCHLENIGILNLCEGILGTADLRHMPLDDMLKCSLIKQKLTLSWSSNSPIVLGQ